MQNQPTETTPYTEYDWSGVRPAPVVESAMLAALDLKWAATRALNVWLSTGSEKALLAHEWLIDEANRLAGEV